MQHDSRTIFVVVWVQAGVAVSAECFRTTTAAQHRAEQLRTVYDENDDDIQVIETTVDAPR